MNTQEMIQVMEAYANGEEVEIYDKITEECFDIPAPIWNWEKVTYRVKKKTIRMYKFAYLNDKGEWLESDKFYRGVNYFIDDLGHLASFKRLDYTMIEISGD